MNEISIWNQLNRVRIIVSIEETPFSNKYHQILMNGDQYQMISRLLQGFYASPAGDGSVNFPIGMQAYKLPENLEEIIKEPTIANVQSSKRA